MERGLICLVVAFLMFSLLLYVPKVSAQNGPEIDLLRYKVMEHPDNRLDAMLTGAADISNDMLRTGDLETLDSNSFTTTSAPGFTISFIAYNIRDTATIRSYYRPEISYWPLHDVEFRHALFHSFDQLGIIPQLYGYIVTPINSLVPPAQSKYYNPSVQKHPFNQGNPFISSAGEHSSAGILKAAGYTFVDADNTGTVTQADYWNCPDGSPIPYMSIWWPIPLTGWGISLVDLFVDDLAAIGLKATAANGRKGFESVPRGYFEYLNDVYGTTTTMGGRFDAFVDFLSLGKMPDHLYPLLHTRRDPGQPIITNAPGVSNPIIGELVETVKFSLDIDEVEAAAKQVQEMLYDPTLPNADSFALSYMMAYSRNYFNSYNPNLRGIVNPYGYGSKNAWTLLNMNWMPGFERKIDSRIAVISMLQDIPESFNPLYARTVFEWELLDRVYDGLININPYNHNDLPWLATDWTITQTTTGMEINFTLRDDVHWQDGKPLTAYDVEFSLEFIKEHNVPRYYEAVDTLDDVVVTSPNTLTIHSNQEGIDLFYDYAALASMLPEHIWNRAWPSDAAVLNYNPTEPYNVAPRYTPGPTPPPTNLFGTGPWTFQFYDTTSKECDFHANDNYFVSQAEVQTLLTNMFWEVGDYNKDGIIDVTDLVAVSEAYGLTIDDPSYKPQLDFNSDGIIDARDMHIAAFHLQQKKEYP